MDRKKDEVSVEGKVSTFIIYLLLLFEVFTWKYSFMYHLGSKEEESRNERIKGQGRIFEEGHSKTKCHGHEYNQWKKSISIPFHFYQ